MSKNKDVRSEIAVVAVGASAGGLEAIKAFISNISSDSAVAYIFVQHLSPDHHSEMVDIASRWTTLNVSEAKNGEPLQPNCLYFLPAATDVSLVGNKFEFRAPEPIKGPRYTIDNFFKSLAEQHRSHVAGIIMSGAGSDGAQGALAIKESGGLVIAEDPVLARFNSMPLAAIEIAKADAVLSPDVMPEYIGNWFSALKKPYDNFNGYSPETLQEILNLVSVKSRNDFTGYKTTTVKRRIERRMGVCHLTDYPSYSELLKKDSQEVMLLANDMLIGVTRFFRDQDAYEIIRQQVIPELFSGKAEDETVRIWVAGCSTGEEAYTLALLAFSYRAEHSLNNPILIFASDIDTESLEIARAGVYSELATESIPADLLNRYFLPSEAGFKITKDVREAIVFAEHNIITNPPFSRIDLVTCRNLLIYLQSDVQLQLMRVFERIITPGGFLFLGSSESLGALMSGYTIISKQWRVFKTLKKTGEHLGVLPALERTALVASTVGNFTNRSFRHPPRERNLRQIVDQFGPMSILISDKNDVLFTTGDLSSFVTMPRGEPNYDLFSLLHPVIRSSVRPLVDRVKRDGVRQVVSGVRFEETRFVRMSAIPVSPLQTEKYILITFEEDFDSTIELHPQREDESWMVIQLEEELQDMREELQRKFEQHRCANEELLAVNEEFIATNEELQSTNEELESSKEELQSLNEELQSTNSVLDAKVQELEHANDDLNNLFSSTDIATLFLSKEFKIKRFTPAMTRLMRLIPADIGRPIIDITHTLRTDNVLEGAEQVLATNDATESQVKDDSGRSYIKRILPYHSIKGPVIGVVMTFTDVTALQAAKEEANNYLGTCTK